MKRLSILLALVSTILVTGCSKFSKVQGLYYSDTPDGMLYIDFQKGGDCYLFFQGEKRKKCPYYKKNDSELEIIGMASVTQNKHTHTCCFGGALGNGIIFDDGSIHFKTQWITEAPDLIYRYLVFYKN